MWKFCLGSLGNVKNKMQWEFVHSQKSMTWSNKVGIWRCNFLNIHLIVEGTPSWTYFVKNVWYRLYTSICNRPLEHLVLSNEWLLFWGFQSDNSIFVQIPIFSGYQHHFLQIQICGFFSNFDFSKKMVKSPITYTIQFIYDWQSKEAHSQIKLDK